MTGARVKDVLTGEKFDLAAKVVVNVAGPWADFVSGMALGQAQKHMLRSQGIHLVFPKVIERYAVVLRTRGGRHFFLVPWRGMTLAGTTDEVYRGSPDRYQVTRQAALNFIDEINEAYPSAQLSLDDVTWTYGGLRPIVEEDTEIEVEVYDASRKYEIYDHAEADRLQGFITVIGGKYTTSRHLAEQLVDLVEGKLDRPKSPCQTAQAPLPGGGFGAWRSFLEAGRSKHPELDGRVIEQISLDYGARREEVVQRMSDSELAGLLDERHPIPSATVAVAVEEEMAMTLDDVLWRRTGLGNTGQLSENAVAAAAQIAGRYLQWSKDRTNAEIQEALDKLARKNIVSEDES